ncbi:hypothetical protein [Thermomonospora cellulosilytica]|uniref:Uncharacterized protein n=1 Tax=Thermomonospora cellulosilytica TaxID=1411118 RepID=A0A7W3R9Y9_9ACTN|nr:hypothetical protein [Thermomonospora cellulosilytica]MBA9005863.1 hypothetical protein [Thermomonospora cellulosilytica]
MTATETEVVPQARRTCPGYGGNAGRCGTPLDPALPEGELCDGCDGHRRYDLNLAAEHKRLDEDLQQALQLVARIQGSLERLAGDELDDLELSGTNAADMQEDLTEVARRLRNVDRAHRLHTQVCQPADKDGQQ